mgnify:CR=1 FL=1
MAAEAHLCIGLVHLRNNAGAEAANALRKAAACRSFDWLLGQMQRDFAARGRPPLSRDTAQRLGALLKSGLGPLGPVLPPEARRADHPFVNVVGTSYVRSFGGNTAFFPLFIGMGPTTNFLTEDSAAVTRRKLEENLRRVDPARDTILILGSDAYYQATNHLKTRNTEAAEPNANDLAVMDRVAERHERGERPAVGDAEQLGRGPLVDDQALADALRAGVIAGAAAVASREKNNDARDEMTAFAERIIRATLPLVTFE